MIYNIDLLLFILSYFFKVKSAQGKDARIDSITANMKSIHMIIYSDIQHQTTRQSNTAHQRQSLFLIYAPAFSLCGVHVCILCLLILFTRVHTHVYIHILCVLPPHTAYPMSVHGVHV